MVVGTKTSERILSVSHRGALAGGHTPLASASSRSRSRSVSELYGQTWVKRVLPSSPYMMNAGRETSDRRADEPCRRQYRLAVSQQAPGPAVAGPRRAWRITLIRRRRRLPSGIAFDLGGQDLAAHRLPEALA